MERDKKRERGTERVCVHRTSPLPNLLCVGLFVSLSNEKHTQVGGDNFLRPRD